MTANDLLDHISRARWFGGKGRRAELVRVDALPWLTAPGEWPAVRPEIAEIGYPDEHVEHYQLLLSYRPLGDSTGAEWALGTDELPDLGRVTRHDATRDPEAMSAVLRALVEQREVTTSTAVLRCHAVEGHALTPDLAPRLFGGEQSNTSVMFGDVAMVKAFRRLEPGHNLDIEVHRALVGDQRARGARLFGWVEAEWQVGARRHTADLAMAVEQLRGARDGWELALAACRAGRDFTSDAEALGAALRGVHDALADHFETGEQSGRTLAATMERRMAAAAREVTELEPLLDDLRVLFGRLDPLRLVTQRLHGDFHLGQTLLTGDGWKIIDFEGEPLKTMAERRELGSPWQDVAGMLRSFDYAAASAAAATTGAAPHTTEEAHQVGLTTRAWASAASSAFLTGYAGSELLGAEESVLLEAYVADKAGYEVLYDARNRPSWVGIPLRAIERLVDTQDGQPGGAAEGTGPGAAREHDATTGEDR